MNDLAGPLTVLLVEDSASDAELILRSLRELPVPVEHSRVASAETLRQALTESAPDVILSDFSMPGFSGQEALGIARELAPEVPFLYVSGAPGEELAIDALQRGAIDYVLKHNLRRLPSSVERALQIAKDRAEKSRMERALRESEERFRTIVETSSDWIWENEWSTQTTYSNGAIARILGFQPEELIGTLASTHMLPEDRQMVDERMPALVAEGRGWHRWRVRWHHRDGSVRVLESSATPRRDESGAVVGFRGVDQDITERLHQEAKIKQLARIHAVLSALGNAVLRTSGRDELLHAACRVAVEQGGFTAAALSVLREVNALTVVARCGDSDVLDAVAPRLPMPIDEPEVYERHPGVLAFREKRRVAIQDFSSAVVPAHVRELMASIAIKSQIALPIGAEPWGLLSLFSESAQDYDEEELDLLQRLTEEIDYALAHIEKSERLEFLAYHNPVTELPNRARFKQQVTLRLQTGPVLVAMVEVANFGRVTTTRGREFGERLLRLTGERLQRAVGPTVIVAHPGEHSYLLAKSALGSMQDEIECLDALLREIDEDPFEIDGEQVFLHINCGVALSPEHGADSATLERNASAALREAQKRRVRIEPFTNRLHERAQRRNELERNLRKALAESEFELFFEPKFNAQNHLLVGAEALLRWRDPIAGLVSPAEFIPLLEETGLIVEAGRWVMRSALETALQWRELGHAGLRIAVNVSARELRDLAFLDECRALLEPHAADQLLDIEVTESLLMDDIEHSIRMLHSLRGLGCRIAIDDFGTGYSSLNYLARLPVDVLKIDQSFTAQIAHSPETMGLVTNIIALAHALSLRVVAEGVEEEEQAKLLRLLRCDELQGYLLGRPMPAADFVEKVL